MSDLILRLNLGRTFKSIEAVADFYAELIVDNGEAGCQTQIEDLNLRDSLVLNAAAQIRRLLNSVEVQK